MSLGRPANGCLVVFTCHRARRHTEAPAPSPHCGCTQHAHGAVPLAPSAAVQRAQCGALACESIPGRDCKQHKCAAVSCPHARRPLP
jgi:hypothetical protein